MNEVGYREIEVSPLIPFFMDFQFAPLAGGLITVGTSQGVGKKQDFGASREVVPFKL
jgi:hypothetical protein